MSTITAAPSETIAILDPSTGEEVGTIPAGDAAGVEAAVRTARAAQPDWARTPAGDRAVALKRIATAVRASADRLAELNAQESGKLVGDARGGAEAGAGAIEQYAELGPLHRGRTLHGDPLAHDAMQFEPRGVAAVIVPWNDPVAIAAQGLAAALVTGNAVVFKPSERAPFCCAALFELFAAELPEGVVTLVQGDARAGRPLAAHPGVDVVLHTGSIAAGRDIARACAERGAKATLELGGNDAVIVDGDVDPQWAAEQVASGAWTNAGQICVGTERVYVHEAVAEPFLAALVALGQNLQVGPATDPATQLGPLVDARHLEAVDAQVAAALAGGARALCGGAPLDGAGSFYPATVLVDVADGSEVVRAETFGPVAPVRVVGSFDEALRLANDTEYGLAATALTCSQEHAARALAELKAGTVRINNVWGGAPGGAAHPRGASGQGLGYGPELLDELTVVKVIHLEPGRPRPVAA